VSSLARGRLTRQRHKSGPHVEKGVRYQKYEAPFGPFRFLVPDPVFPDNTNAEETAPKLT